MTTASLDEQELALDAEVSSEALEHESPVPSYDDINTPVIVTVGLIATIVTLLTIFFVQGLCYQWQNQYIKVRSFDTVNQPVKAIIDQQKSMLNGDEKEGIISIEDAKKKVIEEFGSKAQ
jgi:hypothetical protein